MEQYDEYRGGGRLLDFMRTVQYHLSSARFPGEAPAGDNAGGADNDDDAPPAPLLPDVDDAPRAVPQLQGKED